MNIDKQMKVLMYVLVFTSIIGTIAVSVLGGANLTGASLVLFGLIPLFIVIAFVRNLMKK